jgi:hypothetical protein
MCPTTAAPNSNVQCVGDPSLELLLSDSVVASNDNYCGTCPSLLYTVSGLNCSDYLVTSFCSSGNCSGTAGVIITTTSCSLEDVTTSPELRLTGGTFPVLDCSLIELYRSSICGIQGTWSIVSGGNYRNPCYVKGPGYGCTKFEAWQANSFFVCGKVPTSAPTTIPTAPTQFPTTSPTDLTLSPTTFPTNYPTVEPPPVFTRSISDSSNFSFAAELGGGQFSCDENLTISGPLNSLSITFFFPGSMSGSWPGDMALGIISGADGLQVGGYDSSSYVRVRRKEESWTAVTWPSSWETTSAGTYTTTVDLSSKGWTETAATYTLCLLNGFSQSSPIFYSGSVAFSDYLVPLQVKYCFAVIFGDEVLPSLLVDFIEDTARGLPPPSLLLLSFLLLSLSLSLSLLSLLRRDSETCVACGRCEWDRHCLAWIVCRDLASDVSEQHE